MARLKRYLIVSLIVAGILYYLDGCNGNLGNYLFIGAFTGIISLPFSTKAERKAKREERRAKEEARKRQEEAEENARKAPGCHSMDDVDILTFSSSNNLLTAGNNFITLRIRNRNPYDVIVTIRFKYSDGWSSSTSSFEVGGNKMRTINTSGAAWRKAKDVTIVGVH